MLLALVPWELSQKIWQGSLEKDKGMKGHQRKGFCFSRDLFPLRSLNQNGLFTVPRWFGWWPCLMATMISDNITAFWGAYVIHKAIRPPVFYVAFGQPQAHQRSSIPPMSKKQNPAHSDHHSFTAHEMWIRLPRGGWAREVTPVQRMNWLTGKEGEATSLRMSVGLNVKDSEKKIMMWKMHPAQIYLWSVNRMREALAVKASNAVVLRSLLFSDI